MQYSFQYFFSFSNGLNCLGFLEEMKKCPQGFKKIFLFQNNRLSANQLLDVFAEMKLSEQGSNARNRENDIVCYWRDYIYDKGTFSTNLFNSESNQQAC